jgi:MprA protease rhombosortase-interaction domain-containing protein
MAKRAVGIQKFPQSWGPVRRLKAVAQLILDEPGRYDQRTYIERVDQDGRRRENDWVGLVLNPPPCGTVGCVAGWVAATGRARIPKYDNVSEVARRILKLPPWQAAALFASGAAGYDRPGSMAHARAGVRHIERFMRAHLGYTGPSLLARRRAK